MSYIIYVRYGDSLYKMWQKWIFVRKGWTTLEMKTIIKTMANSKGYCISLAIAGHTITCQLKYIISKTCIFKISCVLYDVYKNKQFKGKKQQQDKKPNL